MSVSSTSVQRPRPRVARYRSANVGSTWFAGAVLSVSGGALIGAAVGTIVGFFSAGGLAGPALGLLVGAIVGLLLGVLAALTIAPTLAWFLRLPALQGSFLPRVELVARVLVALLTVAGWTLIVVGTSEGVGGAVGEVSFWWMLAVLLVFGWWATARVVMVSNTASGSIQPD
jgi:hypothetical protein